MEWKWEENSILNKISEYTPSKDIFDAVCREISRYYQSKKQFKPLKRKLKWIGDNVICEFGFWSSHYNRSNEYVCFEIIPTIYAKDKTNMEKNGLLYIGISPKSFDVHAIDSNQFFEIVNLIEQTIAYVSKIEIPKGFEIFMQERKSTESNNYIFLNRLKNNHK